MSQTPYAEIDLAALERNYRRFVAADAPSEIAAVVKADAYGLGAARVAARLAAAGCRHFFVATYAEGVELRALLGETSDARIHVLDGPVGAEPAEFVRHRLSPVLNSLVQIDWWADAGPAALHVDTGMSRLGLDPAELESSSKAIQALSGLDLLMTHLACADEPAHPLNAAQLETFDRVRQLVPDVPTSIGNSAGGFLAGAYRGDVVRAGIGLYGGNPFAEGESPVEPVVTLRAPILQMRRLANPAPVGYGATFVAAGGALIATLAIGYADGYPRALGSAGVAAINGTHVPVVGRVSMDLTCVDVSAVPGRLEAGDEVELYGRDVAIDEVARAAGTISYELLTRLGRRVERRYRD